MGSMSSTLCATRRLLAAGILFSIVAPLAAQWVNVTANLAGLPSECGNMCLLSAVPGQDRIIAGIAKRGLWQTTDGGATWTALGQGAGSDAIVNRPSRVLYDPMDARKFWVSGIYNGFGVFRTRDGGETFQHLGSVKHNDWVSVDFNNQRRTLLAGGHEQSRTVWKSVDGGQSWTNVGVNLPEGTKHTTHPLLLDASTYLVNASGWGKGTGGVFRTSNGGMSWTQVSALEANGAPLRASDQSLYWPIASGRGIIRSTDQGRTWTQVCGPGVIKGSEIIELPDTRLATVAGKGLKVSSDHGATWTPVGEPTPVPPVGVIYSPARQSFYIWHWDCKDQVLTNAVWRHEYRVESKPAL